MMKQRHTATPLLPPFILSSSPAQRGERIKVRRVPQQDSLLLHRAPPSLTLPLKGEGDNLLNASAA
jgi:hypothetical protein